MPITNGGAEAARSELIPIVRKKLERLIATDPTSSRGLARLLEKRSPAPEDQIEGTASLLYQFGPTDKTAIPLLERARKWYLKGGDAFSRYELAIADLIHRLTYGRPIEKDEPSLEAYHFLQKMLDMVRRQPALYEAGILKSIAEPIRKQLEIALPADRETFLKSLHSLAPQFFVLLMRETYEGSPIKFVDSLRGIEPCAKAILEFDNEKQ